MSAIVTIQVNKTKNNPEGKCELDESDFNPDIHTLFSDKPKEAPKAKAKAAPKAK